VLQGFGKALGPPASLDEGIHRSPSK